MRTFVESPERLQRFFEFAMKDEKKHIRNERDPYLDLYCIGAFSIKVSQGKVLLYLLEKRLNLPSAAVYCHVCFQRYVEVISQKRYKLRAFAFLEINVCYYSGNVVDAIFTEYYNLLTEFHHTLWILMHAVHKYLITEIFLHFGDIYYTTFCQFLKFGIVDICTVKCYYLVVPVMTRSKQE